MGGKSYIAFDNRGNDIKNTESNAVLLTETYSMSVGITDAENSNFWYYAYLTINRANIFIDRCEKYNSESVLGAELYAQYIAEAKFLRSLCFYYLSQIYSQPYILDRDAKAIMLRTVGIDSGVYNNCQRSTISEVYEQILSDLSAENISALSTGSNTIASTSRATDATAKMLKMRVLMAMSNWEEAIAVGETISGYELADDVRSMYNEPYFTKETIFSLPMALTTRPNTQQSLYEFYCNDTDVLAIDSTHGVIAKAAYNTSDDQRFSNSVYP